MPSLSLLIVAFAVLVVTVETVEGAKRCLLTEFVVKHANGSSYCQDCPVCPNGQEPSHRCGAAISAKDVKNVQCLDCVHGKTFSSSNDTFQCYPCTETCPEQQVVLQNCSVTADKKCGDVKCGKGFYHETTSGNCQECSWCCGKVEFDLVKKECVEGGMPKEQSCSVHHKYRCQPTTVKQTKGKKPTPWSATTTVPPSPHTATPTELISTMTTSSTTTGKSSTTKHPKTSVAIKAFIISVSLIVGVSFAAVVTYRRRCSSRSIQSRDPLSGTELGTDVQGAATRFGFTWTYSTKSDSLKVLMPVNDQQAKRPLMAACANTGQLSIEEGMTLTEFSNKNYLAFDSVCELLDISIKGCGNYEQVAKHYGVRGCTIQSRFNTHEGGASKALFEWLGSTYPQLTLGDFFLVLKKINRNDVVARFNV